MDIPRWMSRLYRRVEDQRVGIGISLAMMLALTAGLAPFLDEAHLLEVALVYLLVTLVVAALWGYRVGLAGAVIADLLLNFFFVPPVHTFTVSRIENVVALLVFLAVAVIGATMLESLRRQVKVAEAREAETRILLDVSREMAGGVSARDSLDRFCRTVVTALRVRGCAVARNGHPMVVVGSSGGVDSLSREEESVARAAMTAMEVATLGGSNRKGSAPVITFVPFGPEPEQGVLRINGPMRFPDQADGDQLLAALAREAMMAVHRSLLTAEAGRVADLRRADELKTVLLSSVSHDLRSPLTAIKAAAGNLRDDSVEWSDEDRESFLETIESQTDRLTATVTGLLEMSRIEGGVVRPEFEAIDAGLLLADLAAQATRMAPGRRIDVQAADGLWLTADYGLLYQALTNLVENANRYSKADGAIRLVAKSAPPTVRLSVEDDGPGIAPEDLPHIFDKFYRGASTQSSKGTGLGLSIVKAMIELCSGQVQVTSSAEGTVFTIVLPGARPPGGSRS